MNDQRGEPLRVQVEMPGQLAPEPVAEAGEDQPAQRSRGEPDLMVAHVGGVGASGPFGQISMRTDDVISLAAAGLALWGARRPPGPAHGSSSVSQ